MLSISQTISRRRFLQAAGATSAAAILPRAFADPLGIAPGLQLYTVGAAALEDQRGTLQKVAAIGYKHVESYSRNTSIGAAEFRKQLDDAGLKCPSMHLSFNNTEIGPLLEDAHTVGATYVVSSSLLPAGDQRPKPAPGKNVNETLTLDDFRRIADTANDIAKHAAAAGFQYCYHNHYFEFREQGNGVNGYDILLKHTDPDLVKFEIDCGWMILAGHDPKRYMHDHPGRFRMLHIKDFVKGAKVYTGGPDRPNGTELGRGNIDYRPIFAAAQHAGIRFYFVEQEPPFVEGLTSLQAAEIDYQYLHSL